MNEEAIIRMLPNDVEAEQAVLGSMIIDKDAIASVLEMITPDAFYREDNKEIFLTYILPYLEIFTIENVSIYRNKYVKLNNES